MKETSDETKERLTPKEQAFVDVYAGNGVEAARAAGYEGDDATLAVTASRLLRRDKVMAALRKRDTPARSARIADRQERQRFWTRMMRKRTSEPVARLRASELLAKSEGDFVARMEHSGPGGGPIPMRDYSKLTDEELNARIDALTASYNASKSTRSEEHDGPIDDRVADLMNKYESGKQGEEGK